jgi:hypothetical protein
MIRASINIGDDPSIHQSSQEFAKAMDRRVKPGKTGGNTLLGAPK